MKKEENYWSRDFKNAEREIIEQKESTLCKRDKHLITE